MPNQHVEKSASVSITVRPLREADLAEADRIFHLAFGTFLGLPDPMQFYPDRDFVIARWRAGGDGAFAAVAGGAVIGSSFLANWGSMAVFGPLTIRPDFWDRGAAGRLLEATVERFPQWGTRHAGLFTFPHSAKHVHLYQKFGFWPRFLTAVMSAAVRPQSPPAAAALYSELSADRQAECLKACGQLTDTLFAGLDLQREIRAVAAQRLGDTVLLADNSGLAAFAVCHCGAGTEAGDATCYVKFGAARSAEAFAGLLDACNAFAARRGLTRIEAGVNLTRENAYRTLRARGYRTDIQGVAMHAPNEPGYCRPDVYVIDDWR
jgi:GNAT superfamily N-acetyltransferase